MNDKKIDINNYDATDIKIANVIAMHLYLLICKNMLVNTNDFFYGYNDVFNTAIIVLFAVIYLYLFLTSSVLRNIKPQVIFIIVFLALFIVITYSVDSIRFVSDMFPYSYVKIQMRTFIAYSLPLFVVISSMSSIECLLLKLYDNTLVPFLVALVSFYFSLQPHENGVYMAYGNAVMFLCVILLFKFKHTNNLFTLIQFILTCMFIFISGSRGPLLSIIIGVLWIVIFESSKAYRWIVLVSIVLFGIFLILFFDNIMLFISDVLEKFGIYSRTLKMLLEDNLFYDSERSEYHAVLLARLNTHPIIGLGAFGGEATVGLAHSLYLDILANFGYIFGSMFIVYLVLKTLYKIFNCKNTAYSELMLIMALIIFPRGFFDEAFWSAKEMWVIMALFIQGNATVNRESFNYLSRYKGVTQDEYSNTCH